MEQEELKNKIVIKPWGYEYLVYQNEDVALWHLHINKGESTSMHCHPKKTTGLILLQGEAEVSFLADKRIIKGLDKIMIRRGLFHKTTAITDIDLFEIETPVDKSDLVRLEDNYDRVNMPYETTYRDKDENCLDIPDKPNIWINRQFKGWEIDVFQVNGSVIDEICNDDEIIIFLRGGLKRDINGKSLCALIPGDVGFGKIVSQVASSLDGYLPDTIVMTISKYEK